ncbi:Dimeric alpha-beta barrel [Penicillium hordei]|jgi:Uncharacterized conserved protein|uniref:Dimeric alpha-beta barrel n=1 Tax=Penicillium hordei TaxID=40994 RepID=A0AAD6EFG0_9EURO|nr:Dimeric alpha-beta barrel [Penicillium hordei]KAJ5616316.1 Dimeric alpha-beta barrel [Penicillium hordei]
MAITTAQVPNLPKQLVFWVLDFSFSSHLINPRTPLLKQLEEQPEAGSCVVVNTCHIPAGKVDEAFAAWKIDTEMAKKQPGVISTELHRGVNGSGMMLNYAIWESTAALKA